MTTSEIITITLSALVFIVTLVAVYFSVTTHNRKLYKMKILKSLHNIGNNYWNFIPRSNSFNSIIANEITHILFDQGIHYHGLGKFIFSFDNNNWYEQLTLDGMSKILNNLSNHELNKLNKYYKKIDKRILEIYKYILTFSFFEMSNYNNFSSPTYRGYTFENRNIESSEIILFFLNYDDSGIVKYGQENIKLSDKKPNTSFPFKYDLWALKFKLKTSGEPTIQNDILVIFSDNEINQIKLYYNYPNLFPAEFESPINKENEFNNTIEKVIENDNPLSFLAGFINNQNTEYKLDDQIINIAKTYNYIYCSLNQTNKLRAYSIFDPENTFLKNTHFSDTEKRLAENFIDLVGNNKGKEVDLIGFSKNIWILIFWELIAKRYQYKL